MRDFRSITGTIALLATGLIISTLATTKPQAQIIRLGGSDAEVQARLLSMGYDRLSIAGRGLSSTTYHACQGTDRVEFKVYWDGRLGGRKRIGGCRTIMGQQQIANMLARSGYERVSVEASGRGFAATACRQGDRVELQITPQGDIRNERVTGRCRGGELSIADIRESLRREGYDRIEFTDRELPRYVALACTGNRRFELTMNRRGQITNRQPAGNCAAPIDPYDLPRILAERGYDRVAVVDDRLPRYMVHACKGASKLEVTVDRFGEIAHELRIGQCNQALSRRQVEQSLEAQGFTRIRVTDNGRDGFTAVVCQNNERSELVLTRYGEVTRRVDLGRCSSPSIREVVSSLAGQGMNNVAISAEACVRGRKLRIDLNEFGEELGRRRIGNC